MSVTQACSLPCPRCNNEDRYGKPECGFCKGAGLVGNAASWVGATVEHLPGCTHVPYPTPCSPAEADKVREFSHARAPYWEPKPQPVPYGPPVGEIVDPW
jgi:hypothetical protein